MNTLPEPARVLRPASALTIGELDPSARTGVLVDLRAFAGCAVHGACVATFVQGAAIDPDLVAEQFTAARAAVPIDALKVARLGGERSTRSAAEWLGAACAPAPAPVAGWAPPRPRVVLDASMLDAHGEPRVSDQVVAAWKTHVAPLAEVIVVNAVEAERLFGRPVESRRGMLEATKRLFDLGAPFVLVTGGRLEGHPVDLLYDGTGTIEVGMDRVPGARLAHTGGVLTAALTAWMARGLSVPAALDAARPRVNAALEGALDHVPLGRSVEPLRALWARDRADVEVVSVAAPREA